MAEFPALPIWTDAYLADTREFTAAQHGAYFLLMMTAWRTRENGLPDDDEKLAKWAAMDRRTWLKNKPTIMAKWCRIDGLWHQKRLDDERKRAEHVRHCQMQAGLASALKRKEIQSRHVATELPTPLQPPSPSPSPSIDSVSKEDTESPPTPPIENLIEGGSKDAKPKRTRTKLPATHITDDFQPDFKSLAECSRLGIDPERTRTEFIDYWKGIGKPMCDWDAAFRNRVRKLAEYREERQQRQVNARQGTRDVVGAALRATEVLRQRED